MVFHEYIWYKIKSNNGYSIYIGVFGSKICAITEHVIRGNTEYLVRVMDTWWGNMGYFGYGLFLCDCVSMLVIILATVWGWIIPFIVLHSSKCREWSVIHFNIAFFHINYSLQYLLPADKGAVIAHHQGSPEIDVFFNTTQASFASHCFKWNLSYLRYFYHNDVFSITQLNFLPKYFWTQVYFSIAGYECLLPCSQ